MPTDPEQPGLVYGTEDLHLPGGVKIKPGHYLEDLMAMRYAPPSVTGSANLTLLRALNAQRVAQRGLDALTRAMRVGPFLRLKKQKGEKGGLYTLGDVQRIIAKSKLGGVIRAEKAKDIRAAIRAVNSRESRGRFSLSTRGVRLSSGGLADAGLFLVDTIGQEAIRRLRVSQRNQQLQRIGRRGSLATRAFQSSGSTNRRGSLAASGSVPPQLGRAAKSGGSAGQLQSGKPSLTSQKLPTQQSESQRSKDARTIMGTSQSLPTASKTVSKTGTASAGPLQRLLSSVGSSVFTRPAPTRLNLPTRSTSRTSTLPGLTTLNTVGVGSQLQSAKCDCPKPQKKAKSSSPTCRNPVISRTEKDGIRTTKVRLTCPPSKLKSLLP